jgi:hypothetical protein
MIGKALVKIGDALMNPAVGSSFWTTCVQHHTLGHRHAFSQWFSAMERKDAYSREVQPCAMTASIQRCTFSKGPPLPQCAGKINPNA